MPLVTFGSILPPEGGSANQLVNQLVNQLHGNQLHGNQLHGNQLHGNQLHGNQLHGNQLHGVMPGVVPGTSAANCLENPHEILGLPADEADAVAIVEAAAAKLRTVRAANGSELVVRRAVEAVIVTARKLMLAKMPESGTFGHSD